jgi:Zn-dependent M16 (insulinase) family peptidase
MMGRRLLSKYFLISNSSARYSSKPNQNMAKRNSKDKEQVFNILN